MDLILFIRSAAVEFEDLQEKEANPLSRTDMEMIMIVSIQWGKLRVKELYFPQTAKRNIGDDG